MEHPPAEMEMAGSPLAPASATTPPPQPNRPSEAAPIAGPVAEASRRILRNWSPAAADEHAQAEERRHQRDEAEYRRETLARFLRSVGERYVDCTLASFQATTDPQRAVLAKLKAYADSLVDEVRRGAGVVLYGPSGTGKDHLLIGLGRLVAEKGGNIRWANGADLFAEFRDAIGGNVTEREIVDKYTAPRVLVLSDPLPPAGTLTEFQTSVLFRILDKRYRDRLPTWVSLNVADGREAEQRMGVALVDRLRDGSIVCHCNWQSFRKAR